MTKETVETGKPESKKTRGFLFWVGRFFLVLLAIFFSIMLLIEIPFVQMWGIGKITKSISKSLNAEVTLGGFNLSPISDLTLENLFIASPDHPEDTLLKVEKLQVDFQNLWDLLYRRMTVNQLFLKDGYLNIEKLEGDTLTNLDLALLRLLPERDTSKAPFFLDLEKVNATQLRVKVDDHTKGSLINMVIQRADVEFDTLDIVGQYLGIGDLDFDQPLILITSKARKDVEPSIIEKTDKSWAFDIAAFRWTDGKVYIDNQNKPEDTSQVYGIDFAHLIIVDSDIDIDSLQVRGTDVQAKNVNMHILHQNGFELEHFDMSEAIVSSNGIDLKNLRIKTKDSKIENSIELKFSGFTDFRSFADSVELVIPQADIHLHVGDLLAFAPSLGKVGFFDDNKDKHIDLKGDVSGHINRLKVIKVNASIGNVSIRGDFRSRDLAIPGKQLLSMDLDNASFSAYSLKELFPSMKIPPLLNKLGQVNFTGKFDGYPDDFVAYGLFNTSLGAITLDMNLNILQGIENGNFSGTVSLDNFDMGTFLDQPDLGRVTMTGKVIEGTGLTSSSLSARLAAEMPSFTYKNYTYHNTSLDGQITRKLFNGKLDINDPNVSMHFEGSVDFRGTKPILDFVSRIDSINFLELGFGKSPIVLRGNLDVDMIAAKKLNQFVGTLTGENIEVTIKDHNYFLDSIYFNAVIDSISNDRFYSFKSDIASGVFSGQFDPLALPGQLQQYLHEHYPSSIDAPKKLTIASTDQKVSWDLHIHDSRDWFDLLGFKGLVLKQTYTHGTINLKDQQTEGFLELPELHYAGFNVYGSTITFKENKGRADMDFELIAADLKENFFFEDVLISGSATDDSVKMRIRTDHIADIIDELDLEVIADPEGGEWTFSLNPIRLDMLGERWTVPAGNRIQIKKNEFSLDNFELVSGDQKIIVDDINNKGISALISGFDMNYLNTLWVNDKFKFSGVYTLSLEVDNVYKIKQLSTVLHIPALKVNNEPYGEWTLNAAMDDPKDSVKIDLAMHNIDGHLTGKGAYLPPINSIPKEKQNYLRLYLEGVSFPLDFLEFLLGGNVRDTEGSVDFTLNLEGKTNKLNPRGKGRVYNGSTTINYLGTSYSFHDQGFEITEDLIDLSGARLYDVMGNSAIIQGGLTHRYLKNIGFNASIHSDRILGLDVTSEENTSFYGKGIGSVDAVFSGTVANPNMHIISTAAKGTHIYIPLSGSALGSDKDFVIFLQNGMLPLAATNQFKLSGINLTMNLTITPDAEVEIIFDDNTGEVLRGRGSGDLQLSMTRTGNFSMYGNYTISEGDYLFTNIKIVRKQFELLPGGEIHWDGDPYDATINVRAKYKGLKAPVYNLIQEYLVENPNLTNQAKERTDVDLTMILTGSLLHPNIDFDIAFPNLTGEIKGYVDSKIRALKANEAALNEQVVGLLFARTFLPTTSGVNTGTISKGIDNTLSELISTTLSSYLGGLLSDIIPEGEFLSGIDFQFAADIPLTSGGAVDENGQYLDPNLQEYTANLPLEFFNDRLSVNVGGNYVVGSTVYPTGDEGQFGGDVTFEWKITPDGRLRVRAYNRNNVTVEGRKNKIGAGLAWGKEFNSFKEIWTRKKKKPKEKETEPSGG